MNYVPGNNCVKVIPPAGKRTKPIIIQGYFRSDENEKDKRERLEILAKNFQKFGLDTDV